VRLRRLAWDWQERLSILVCAALWTFLSLLWYMPDDWLWDPEYLGGGTWPYGPGRRLCGILSIIAGELMLLCALVDGAHALLKRTKRRQ
jgi:hypothetical protein